MNGSSSSAHDTKSAEHELQRYLQLIQQRRTATATTESTGPSSAANLQIAPLITWSAKEAAQAIYGAQYPQYALLGHLLGGPLDHDQNVAANGEALHKPDIEPVLVNTNVPFSAFICGKQGSGKSYTLSCLLEGCLLNSPYLAKLPKPLSGIVFNYDSQSINVAEAAYICSAGVPVTVFVSPSNFKTMEAAYRRIPGSDKNNLHIQPLYLKPHHLTTERMKRLMAFGDATRDPPLYMQTLIKTLRQMALETNGDSSFNYDEFRRRIFTETFTGHQSGPLELRLDLLESFMEGSWVDAAQYLGIDRQMFYGDFNKNPKIKYIKKIKPTTGPELLAGSQGRLTIIDLTDPVIDSESACVLFDICLAIFLEKTSCGKVVALDEAHNYISKGSASDNLMNSILKTVREQRHKGARIIVATQEPTISPKFLDLCSMSIIHSFDSPEWFSALRAHLCGASTASGLIDRHLQILFNTIGDLQVGESILFSSQALLDVTIHGQMSRLGGWHKKLMTRPRMSKDGGRSVVANDVTTSVPNHASNFTAPTPAKSSLSSSSGMQGSRYAQTKQQSNSTPVLASFASNSEKSSLSNGINSGHTNMSGSTVPRSRGTLQAPSCEPMIEPVEGTTQKAIFMCLAATEMFKDYSFEEMRVGDYMEGRRGPV